MGLMDSVLKAPGKLVGGAAEVAASLPAVAIDVAEKAVEGLERGGERIAEGLDGKRK